MRIVIFNWRDIRHPHAGGAEAVTFEHAKAWVKAGHNVTWFSSGFRGGKREEIVEGIKIVRRGNQLLGVHIAALFWYLKHVRGRVDLVVDQFHGIPFFAPLYVAEKKLAFIHEVTCEVWFLNHLPGPFRFLAGLVGYFTEPWIFRLFYRQIPFLTVSESTKKDLVSWGIPQNNITVIHNGLRAKTLWPFPKKEKKPTIIFLGALARDKGIEEAIKAFSLINQRKRNFQFWVVGRGDPLYLRKLKAIVKNLGLVKKVRFFGFVSEKKKFELLARAHILVNPSVREGWGLVVIEANAVGTPAVVYNVPGLRDSTKHGVTGLICAKNITEELAKNVIKLLEDRDLYQELQKNALKESKKYSWEKATKLSLNLISRILNERG